MDKFADHMIQNIESFFIGIIGSLAASILFLKYVLNHLRPKILISPYIAIEVDKTGKKWYWFKILNTSSYDAFEVNFRLEQKKLEPVRGGCFNVHHEDIPLHKHIFAHIPKYLSDKEINSKKVAPHAMQVRTSENLEGILNDKFVSLTIQVTLKHGLTGISDSFEQDFPSLGVLKAGDFKFGNQLVIE